MCGDVLDRELGDLITPANPLPGGRLPGPVQPKLFTYVRYNAELTTAGLAALGLPGIVPEHVQQMDSVEHINELQEVGKAVAAKRVSKEHFSRLLRPEGIGVRPSSCRQHPRYHDDDHRGARRDRRDLKNGDPWSLCSGPS